MYLEDIADIKKTVNIWITNDSNHRRTDQTKNDELQRKKKFPSLLQRLTNYLVDGTTLTKRKNKLDKNKCGN